MSERIKAKKKGYRKDDHAGTAQYNQPANRFGKTNWWSRSIAARTKRKEYGELLLLVGCVCV